VDIGDSAVTPYNNKLKLEEMEYVLPHCPLYEAVSSELSLVADEHTTGCDIIIGRSWTGCILTSCHTHLKI